MSRSIFRLSFSLIVAIGVTSLLIFSGCSASSGGGSNGGGGGGNVVGEFGGSNTNTGNAIGGTSNGTGGNSSPVGNFANAVGGTTTPTAQGIANQLNEEYRIIMREQK